MCQVHMCPHMCQVHMCSDVPGPYVPSYVPIPHVPIGFVACRGVGVCSLMCVCVCVRGCVSVCLCGCTYVYIYTCIYVYIYIYIFVFSFLCICVCVCSFVRFRMWLVIRAHVLALGVPVCAVPYMPEPRVCAAPYVPIWASIMCAQNSKQWNLKIMKPLNDKCWVVVQWCDSVRASSKPDSFANTRPEYYEHISICFDVVQCWDVHASYPVLTLLLVRRCVMWRRLLYLSFPSSRSRSSSSCAAGGCVGSNERMFRICRLTCCVIHYWEHHVLNFEGLLAILFLNIGLSFGCPSCCTLWSACGFNWQHHIDLF